MKIVTSLLESIAGIERFPLISFIIFFIFFLLVTLYVIKLDKRYIKEMSNYPISNEDTQLNSKNSL